MHSSSTSITSFPRVHNVTVTGRAQIATRSRPSTRTRSFKFNLTRNFQVEERSTSLRLEIITGMPVLIALTGYNLKPHAAVQVVYVGSGAECNHSGSGTSGEPDSEDSDLRARCHGVHIDSGGRGRFDRCQWNRPLPGVMCTPLQKGLRGARASIFDSSAKIIDLLRLLRPVVFHDAAA